jgi:hypothetical protein
MNPQTVTKVIPGDSSYYGSPPGPTGPYSSFVDRTWLEGHACTK